MFDDDHSDAKQAVHTVTTRRTETNSCKFPYAVCHADREVGCLIDNNPSVTTYNDIYETLLKLPEDWPPAFLIASTVTLRFLEVLVCI